MGNIEGQNRLNLGEVMDGWGGPDQVADILEGISNIPGFDGQIGYPGRQTTFFHLAKFLHNRVGTGELAIESIPEATKYALLQAIQAISGPEEVKERIGIQLQRLESQVFEEVHGFTPVTARSEQSQPTEKPSQSRQSGVIYEAREGLRTIGIGLVENFRGRQKAKEELGHNTQMYEEMIRRYQGSFRVVETHVADLGETVHFDEPRLNRFKRVYRWNEGYLGVAVTERPVRFRKSRQPITLKINGKESVITRDLADGMATKRVVSPQRALATLAKEQALLETMYQGLDPTYRASAGQLSDRLKVIANAARDLLHDPRPVSLEEILGKSQEHVSAKTAVQGTLAFSMILAGCSPAVATINPLETEATQPRTEQVDAGEESESENQEGEATEVVEVETAVPGIGSAEPNETPTPGPIAWRAPAGTEAKVVPAAEIPAEYRSYANEYIRTALRIPGAKSAQVVPNGLFGNDFRARVVARNIERKVLQPVFTDENDNRWLGESPSYFVSTKELLKEGIEYQVIEGSENAVLWFDPNLPDRPPVWVREVITLTNGEQVYSEYFDRTVINPDGTLGAWQKISGLEAYMATAQATETLADGSVMSWADGLPTGISVGGAEVKLEHPGIWVTGEEVRWWNKQSEKFEVLEHIKPNGLVYKGDLVTGLVTGVPAEIATGSEPKFPVALVNLASGELARGDFDSEAPKQILYNQAVKMNDGVWYQWETGNQTWNIVTDEITRVILELGEDPRDEYKEEKWADGTYLVKQYNGARLAVRGENSWEPITDLTVKYGKYLESIRSIDRLLGSSEKLSPHQGSQQYEATIRRFRGVFVDYETKGIWFEPSFGEYVGLYTVTILVPITSDNWQTVEVIWGTNYPQPRINLSEIVKVSGGTGGRTITNDPDRAWRRLQPGQVIDAGVWIKMTGSGLNLTMQQRQDLVTATEEDITELFSRLPKVTGGAGSLVDFPADLTVNGDALSIPYGY